MSNLYAIFFAGGINNFSNYPRYSNDLKRGLTSLSRLSSFNLDRTTVLSGPGGQSFDVAGRNIVALPGTREKLHDTINHVITAVSPDDHFVFFASNHGGRKDDAAKSTLWCWQKQFILDEEFAAWCEPIASKYQVFILGQCYSGGFVRPLASSKRLIMTASAWDEVSWASEDTNNDEFLLRVCEAVEAGCADYNSRR